MAWPLRDRRYAAALSSVSGTSSMVASQATSRSPNRNASGVSSLAWMPRTRANRAANGLGPNRCQAWVNADEVGVVAASPAAVPASCRHTDR